MSKNNWVGGSHPSSQWLSLNLTVTAVAGGDGSAVVPIALKKDMHRLSVQLAFLKI